MESEVANGSVEPVKESEKTQNIRGRGLYVLLGVLCVAIVGLVIGIVVVNVDSSEKRDAATQTGDVVDNAVTINEAIMDKLSSDPNYNFANAQEEFLSEMIRGDNERRLGVAVFYAEYAYSVNGNVDEAVGILNGVEELANSEKLKMDYYAALCDFYKKAEETEQFDVCNQKLMELVPDDVVDLGVEK